MKCAFSIFGVLVIFFFLINSPMVQAIYITTAKMNNQANELIRSMEPAQQSLLLLEFDDKERQNWSYIPRKRMGLNLKSLQMEQREMVFSLLKSGLSASGYMKAQQIMLLETVLAEIENSSYRDPELYYLSIFGTPSPQTTWGYRFEGHHLSLNFTLVEGKKLSVVPSFWGANPAHVFSGPHRGLRPLGKEEDRARDFLGSLNPEQIKRTVVSERAPHEIFTGTERQVSPFALEGIGYSALNEKQRQLLMHLIHAYLENFPADVQQQRKTQIEQSGMDSLHFSWHGGTEKGQKHYYRIQSNSFIIEYDNFQNDANHIHTVWREFNGDFGKDLLREHLANHKHH